MRPADRISPIIADAARLAGLTPARLAEMVAAEPRQRPVRLSIKAPMAIEVFARRSGDCIVGLTWSDELAIDARDGWAIATARRSELPETIMIRSTPWPLARVNSDPLLRPGHMVKLATRQAETGPQVFQLDTPAESIATD